MKNLFRNKSVKNASWLISGRIIQMVLSLFVSLLTARYLGPNNYGLINYALAYTSFFSSICTLGINSIIVKELIDNRENEGTIIGTTLVLQTISSFISSGIIVSIVSIIDNGEPITIVVVLLCCIGMIFNNLHVFTYWYQSNLNSKVSTIISLIGYVVVSLYRIILLITAKDVRYFAFATSVDYFVVGVLLFFSYRFKHGQKLSFSFDCSKKILKSSLHFVLPSLMVSIYGQTDKLMLKQMISDAEIGYYSTAVAICGMWVFILTAIIDSMNPVIMELHKKNQFNAYRKKNVQLYHMVFYIALFVSLIISIFAKLIVSILYGDAYLPSVQPLRIITWYTAFSYLGVARNSWIVCENKQKYLIWIYISSAVFNVVLNSILIPFYGSSGAAFASLLSQIFSCIVVPAFIKPLRENVKMIFDSIISFGKIK